MRLLMDVSCFARVSPATALADAVGLAAFVIGVVVALG